MRIEQTKMLINEVYGKTKTNKTNCWWGWQKFTFRFWKLFCFNFLSSSFIVFYPLSDTRRRPKVESARVFHFLYVSSYRWVHFSGAVPFFRLLYIQSHVLCSALWTLNNTSVENSSPPLLANGRRVSVRLDSRKRPIPVSRRTAFAIIVNSHFPFACRKFNQFRVGCWTFAPTDRSYLTESVPWLHVFQVRASGDISVSLPTLAQHLCKMFSCAFT